MVPVRSCTISGSSNSITTMTILITRPSPAGDDLVIRLQAQGLAAWSLPLIKFTPGNDLIQLTAQLATLRQGDMVFILSQHAIHFAQSYMAPVERIWPDRLNYYAIGHRTALAFQAVSGLAASYPVGQENSETLLQLPALKAIQGKRALILRGNGGRALLEETLNQRGGRVTLLECYQRHPCCYNGSTEARRWRKHHIDTLVVTSGEMLQLLYSLFPMVDRVEWLLRCRLVVVSERLATLARGLGWQIIVVADGADNDVLLRTLHKLKYGM